MGAATPGWTPSRGSRAGQPSDWEQATHDRAPCKCFMGDVLDFNTAGPAFRATILAGGAREP